MAKYFTLGELCASDIARIPNTPTDQATLGRIDALMERCLDKVREMWGKPIGVKSGYRSLELNRAVGGDKNSQHMRGEAAHITAGTREDNRLLFNLIASSNIEFDVLASEAEYRWIHISYCTDYNRQIVKHL